MNAFDSNVSWLNGTDGVINQDDDLNIDTLTAFTVNADDVNVGDILTVGNDAVIGDSLTVTGTLSCNTSLTTSQLSVGTTNTTTAKCYIQHTGTGPCLRVDDDTADTTYFSINENGYVGINTSNPNTTLDVRGSCTFRNFADTTNATFDIRNIYDSGGLAGGELQLGGPNYKIRGNKDSTGTNVNHLQFYSYKDHVFYRRDNSSGIELEGMRLLYKNTGGDPNTMFLGIGTAAPVAKLHVVQTGTSDCFRVDDQTSDTTIFRVDADGNVGIKMSTSALSYALDVNGAFHASTVNTNVTTSTAFACPGFVTVTNNSTLPFSQRSIFVFPDSVSHVVLPSGAYNGQVVYFLKDGTNPYSISIECDTATQSRLFVNGIYYDDVSFYSWDDTFCMTLVYREGVNPGQGDWFVVGRS